MKIFQSWSELEISSLTDLARQQVSPSSVALILGRAEWDVRRQANASGVVLTDDRESKQQLAADHVARIPRP